MDVISKRLLLEEFKEYVKMFNFKNLSPNKLVIHHTWRPTKAQWQGAKSMAGLKAYYESKGWRAGPHLFIAEDGIWLFTPMNKMGIHAGRGNWRSIGIEVVGDYDVEKWEGMTKHNAIGAITVLMDKLGISTENVKFHRDYSRKSCPGHAITKQWLFRELNFYRQADEVPNWPDVAGKLSSQDVWRIAKSKGYVSDNTKFNDENTVGKTMIYLARLFPDKFKE